MKNILVITSSYLPINGGQELGLQNLINGIQATDKQYKISILTPKYNKKHLSREIINNIEIFRYHSSFIKYPSRWFKPIFNMWVHIVYGFLFMKRYIKIIKPDFILVYFLLPSGIPAMYYAKKFDIPNAVFIGGSDILYNSKSIQKSLAYILSMTDKIIVTSNHIRQIVKIKHSINDKNIINIPYGIKINSLGKINKKYGPIKILCVQRLVKSKGTHYLIAAIKNLVESNYNNIVLDIIGDGEEIDNLRKMTEEFNLSKVITFHGNIDNDKINNYYTEADIFVFPTLAEGFGIVLLEAMVAGNIIVATNCTSIPDIIKHERNGLLFQPGDVGELTNILKKIIDNIKKYKYMSDNAKKDVRMFDIKNISKRLERQIDQILTSKTE